MPSPSPLLALTILVLLAVTFMPADARAQDGKVVIAFYEVTDLLRKVPDFPAPKLGLDGLEPSESGGLFEEEEEESRWTIDDLVELIKSHCFPDSWEEDGISIVGQRGVIIISHREDVQFETAKYLQKLRRRYRVEARVVAMTPKAIARFANAEDEGTVTVVPSRRFNRRIQQLHDSGDVELISTPRLTVHDGQLANFSLVNQTAYVSGYDVTEGCADPVVSVLQEGLLFEVRAERGPSASQTQLTWSITNAQADEPMDEVEVEGDGWTGTVSTPVIRQTVVQGNSFVKRGTVLMIRGLEPAGVDDADQGDNERELVVFLKVSRVEQRL